jgi:hypothetical protein
MLQTKKTWHGQTAVFQEFGDVSEFIAAAKAVRNESKRSWDFGFSGRQTFEQACESALMGNDELAGRAAAMLSRLDDLHIEVPRPVWSPAMAGAFPSVPAFLAGEPESMLAMTDEASDVSPIRIYVSTTSSAGINASDLEKRGVTILALVMALVQIRPVELLLYTEADGDRFRHDWSCPIVRVNTAPLHLGQAAYMLSHQGFSRGLSYCYCSDALGFCGGWMFGAGDEYKRIKIARELLECGPKDLVLGGAYSNDPIYLNPEKWIRDRIAEFCAD